MTRKRFIKLLMEAGMSRNDAADCAALTQNAGRPYFKVLGELLTFHRHQFNHRALCISWLKIRYTIIHGRNSLASWCFANIDEVHTWPADVTMASTICIRPDGKMRIIEVSVIPAGGAGT